MEFSVGELSQGNAEQRIKANPQKGVQTMAGM